MAYRGRKQLGSYVFVGLLCTDKNKTPFAPTEAPTMDVFSSSGKVLTQALPAVDGNFLTGLFGYSIFLNSAFATGTYTVVYRYRSGSFAYMETDTFEVIPGGDVAGAVVSMFPFLPGANAFLFHELDGGTIAAGKNPRF